MECVTSPGHAELIEELRVGVPMMMMFLDVGQCGSLLPPLRHHHHLLS